MFSMHRCLPWDWSVSMEHWFGFSVHYSTKINRKYQLWYNVSIIYPKPGLTENTINVELGAASLVQHNSVFSARPSLGYETLLQCEILSQPTWFLPLQGVAAAPSGQDIRECSTTLLYTGLGWKVYCSEMWTVVCSELCPVLYCTVCTALNWERW